MNVSECIRAFVSGKGEYSIYEGNSETCMSGRTCFGVVISQGNSFMDFLVEFTRYLDERDVDDVNCELEGVTYDEFGLDTIVYFPNLKE